MADADPIKTMEEGGMRTWQWLAVAMTVALNALDGFDVLSISFAAPGIAKEWGVDQGILGWVLSMELLG
ncbi:MAG: MFS transporter, partial [Parasphingorhabdus sp.]